VGGGFADRWPWAMFLANVSWRRDTNMCLIVWVSRCVAKSALSFAAVTLSLVAVVPEGYFD